MNAQTVVAWVERNLHENGGVRAWEGYTAPYPEVTGYLIPSLLKHGARPLAEELARWLCSDQVQNRDGSWCGLDGRKHTFDTACIVQGLMAVGGHMENVVRAMQWLNSMRRDDGFLRKHDRDDGTALYLCRASAIIGDRATVHKYAPTPTWGHVWGAANRAHYIAYALEGMQWMNMDITAALDASKGAVKANGLMPFMIRTGWLDDGDDDVVATLQFALLFLRAGRKDEAARLIEAAEQYITPDGGVWQSSTDKRALAWGAKYYLDCAGEML